MFQKSKLEDLPKP